MSGITTGTADVCIYDSGVTSLTVLQYYFGGSWVSATGVVVTPGVSNLSGPAKIVVEWRRGLGSSASLLIALTCGA